MFDLVIYEWMVHDTTWNFQ